MRVRIRMMVVMLRTKVRLKMRMGTRVPCPNAVCLTQLKKVLRDEDGDDKLLQMLLV